MGGHHDWGVEAYWMIPEKADRGKEEAHYHHHYL